MKNTKNRMMCVLLMIITLFIITACSDTSNESPDSNVAEWLSPMLSVNISANTARVFNGALPVDVGNNEFGRENRGRIVAAPPEENQPLELAQLTADALLAAGAVKLTANFAYGGDDEYNVRFRFRVDRFQGHSITQYGLGAAAGVMILWEDADGIWWNIRRTGWGGEFTGGELTPGYFYPPGHELAGTPYPVYTFTINSDTASRFASQDFYIIILEEVPFRTNDQGEATDDISGYVITYQAELPDHDGHFHNFAVLSSTSVYIPVLHVR